MLAAAGHSTGVRRPRLADLTDRQVDVLRLLATGLSNREIAERLVISPRTAERHVQDVYDKIGLSTRAGAALYAMEHGLWTDLGRSTQARRGRRAETRDMSATSTRHTSSTPHCSPARS